MKSIFRYPGGKTKKSIREKILNKAPKEFAEYREPFVGGGGIFFSIDPKIKRWVNDKDENLISVYLALKNRPEDFINKCREILPPQSGEPLAPARQGGKPLYNARLKEHFDYLIHNNECDQALKYFFTNRTNWAGRVNYDIPSRMYFSNPNGWNIVETTLLEEASKILHNTTITCVDYSDLLECDGDNVWIYCDPPYYKNTNLPTRSQLYKYNFTLEDHKVFAEKIKQCRHKVCISYDDVDGVIKELFKDFNIYEESWTYCGTSSAEGCSKYKKTGKELIITNYE